MNFQRSSGVLLHITSLPSTGGIGDLGPAAHEFVAFLAAAGQHIWQVLPLSPTGYGNSPYAASSAFAGNPLLLSLETLEHWGWSVVGMEVHRLEPTDKVDFDAVERTKLPALYAAADFFLTHAPQEGRFNAQWEAYQAFCQAEAAWLDDYALYAVLRRVQNTGAWTAWPEPLKRREPQALAAARHEHCRELEREKALQFAFSLQWNALREAAAQHSIRILGDVAIFVNMDSADVWTHPELFELDENLEQIRVAGVPPDYFSPTGQRWGNPLYRWDMLAEDGYQWWVERMRRAHALYDIVRLDHFRGFEAYWAIPVEEATAVKGEWIKGPGADLFHALEAALGPLPLVAEDLGLITPEVDALRTGLGLPGMRVLQFGFSDKGAHIHLPPRHTPDTVAYTGTHDNDTTQGWWRQTSLAEHDSVEDLVGAVSGRPVWALIRVVSASVAQLAIFPAQDLLELGSEARMNTPAVPSGNWSWRAHAGQWGAELAAQLRSLAAVTDRDNDPLPLK
ncbi:4-alpha-glucanotransferase [Telmatobacter bradus]|uniref:4-alpha-glucanotransferase n=1 Tax=Telmatobacter bradus TaxID=474953 RepID=UPI003B43A4AA